MAALSLAMGFGAAMSVHDWARSWLWRPVPGVRQPEQVLSVELSRGVGRGIGISYAALEEIRAFHPSLARASAQTRTSVLVRDPAGASATAYAAVVSDDYFDMLGVRPVAGALFADRPTRAPVPGVAVISDHLWRTQFGASPATVGRSMEVNGTPFVVVGVASPAFRGTDRTSNVDVWVPLSSFGALQHSPGYNIMEPRRKPVRELLVRSDGADAETIAGHVRSAFARYLAAHPQLTREYEEYTPAARAIGLRPADRARLEGATKLVYGLAAVLLAIAIANALNLAVVDALWSRQDHATRQVLGAPASRLRQHALAPVLIVVIVGVALAIGVGLVLNSMFEDYELARRASSVADGGMSGTTVLVLMVVALPVIAALVAVRALVFRGAGASARLGTRVTRAGRRAREVFTVAQVVGAVTLAVAALLMSRSLAALRRVELGFEPAGLVAMTFDPTAVAYGAERATAFRERAVAELQRTSGVSRVAVVSPAPFGGSQSIVGIASDSGRAGVKANVVTISPGYFEALGVPVRAGSVPQRGSGDAVTISRGLALALFGQEQAIGRQLRLNTGGSRTVAAVVGDTRTTTLRGAPELTMYEEMRPAWDGSFVVLVRAASPVTPAVLAAVGDRVDPALPLIQVERVTRQIEATLGDERLLGRFAVVGALLAGVLALIGVYGLVASTVEQRHREFGLRMALGATPLRVIAMVLREAMTLAFAGAALGLLLAAGLARALSSRLFEITALDPLSFVTAGVVVFLACLVAAVRPALRGASNDPAESLRST